MKEFMPLFASIATGIVTLTAVWLTQKGNKKVQKDLLELQIKRDEMKEKRNELKETLEIYNRILKVDGESIVIIDNGGALEEFDFNVYQKEVRPIFYEKYHLLHEEVAERVALMDQVIKNCNLFQEVEREDHMELCGNYNRLIRIMRRNIYSFRKEVQS
ncbi:phage protein [Bacillus cereus VD196]|uniref:Phage protein n=1 Tax=Bacillus cereus VD196 TaxID=1053243 RepID=A0A9W5PXF8_BACCE|nr:hypothetical protein [Bacillus cereus]EOO57088.1 phage protein [Bacillus cereus VD196]EOO65832.1 phage protein [Bacillus cereus VD196]